MATDYDVCIVGSGAGAGPVAYTLSNQGYKVLVLEKGSWFNEADFTKDEIAICRRSTYTPSLQDEPQVIESQNKEGEWKAESNKESGWDFWNGNMVGGSSNLMSGFFHRLKPIDFRLATEFGTSGNDHTVDWPITYEELEPFYTLTESLVGVSGRVEEHPFLEPRSTPNYPFPPLAEHPFAAMLDKSAAELGYQALPMARAILSKPFNQRNACSYSAYCGSYACTTGAKGSSRAALLNGALRTGNCEIRPNSQVFHLHSNRKGKLTELHYYNAQQKKQTVSAKIFVVACQAIETSRLLLLSTGAKFPNGLANNSGQVGKNLLFSAGGMGGGVFTAEMFAGEEFQSVNDYHLFVNRFLQDWYVFNHPKYGRIKGGTIDFLQQHANPIRRAVKLKRQKGKLVWGSVLKQALEEEFQKRVKLNFEVFCDWHPNPDCQVTLNSSVKDKFGLPVAQIRVGHHPADLIPGEYLAERGKEVLRAMGAQEVKASVNGNPSPNLVAGGCRFGNDPETSVLDKDCRSHEVENLFVTDGSFMPTGGSVTPTFTVYANAFRVAQKIAGQLRQCY